MTLPELQVSPHAAANEEPLKRKTVESPQKKASQSETSPKKGSSTTSALAEGPKPRPSEVSRPSFEECHREGLRGRAQAFAARQQVESWAIEKGITPEGQE